MMEKILPPQFLFRYRMPVLYADDRPYGTGCLLNLPEEHRLPDFSELGGSPRFCDIRAVWNREGLGFSFTVSGKTQPVVCNTDEPTESEGIQVWLDTRNTQSIHRASRFCHLFCLLPSDTGSDGAAPFACQLPIPRARADAPLTAPNTIAVHVERQAAGYTLEAWFRREQLHGYAPEDALEVGQTPLLGFYYSVRDSEQGEQTLSVGREFPFTTDPSLWSTLELHQ